MLAGIMELQDRGMPHDVADNLLTSMRNQDKVKYKSFLTSIFIGTLKKKNDKKIIRETSKINNLALKGASVIVKIRNCENEISEFKNKVTELNAKITSLKQRSAMLNVLANNTSNPTQAILLQRTINANNNRIQSCINKIYDIEHIEIPKQNHEIESLKEKKESIDKKRQASNDKISDIKSVNEDLKRLSG